MLRATRIFLILLATAALMAGCSSNDTPTDPQLNEKLDTAVVRGDLTPGTFDYEFESESPGGADDPAPGSFKVRIKDMSYEADPGALVFDMWVVNASDMAYPEPVSLTFMQFNPETVEVLNADNDSTGVGAMFFFAFADSDTTWSPGEESFVRTVQLKVGPGVSVSFVSKIEIGEDEPVTGGTIGGMAWLDENRDGVMDPDESGLEGVGILLHAGTEPDPVKKMMETLTDSMGYYSFGALDAGHYTVELKDYTDPNPTTAPEIQVLLVEYDGEVVDFLEADFGLMWDDMPDTTDAIVVGDCVNAKGWYQEDPDRLEAEIFYICDRDGDGDCDDDDCDDCDGEDCDDCEDEDDGEDEGEDEDKTGFGGKCWGVLSGPITDVDLENRDVAVMGTWVHFPEWDHDWDHEFEGWGKTGGDHHDHGFRVRVKAYVESTEDGDKVMACGIHFWRGYRDRVRGIVQEVMKNDDDEVIGVKVLNTMVMHEGEYPLD